MDEDLKEFVAWMFTEKGLAANSVSLYANAVRGIKRAAFDPRTSEINRDALIRYIDALPVTRRAGVRTAWRCFVAFGESKGVRLPDFGDARTERFNDAAQPGYRLIESFAFCFNEYDPLEAVDAVWGKWDLDFRYATFTTMTGHKARVPRPLLDAIRAEFYFGRPEETLLGDPVLSDPRRPGRPMAPADLGFAINLVRRSTKVAPLRYNDPTLDAYAAQKALEVERKFHGVPAAAPLGTWASVAPTRPTDKVVEQAATVPEPETPEVARLRKDMAEYFDSLRTGVLGAAPPGQSAISKAEAIEAEKNGD